jgi:hypothetical protein
MYPLDRSRRGRKPATNRLSYGTANSSGYEELCLLVCNALQSNGRKLCSRLEKQETSMKPVARRGSGLLRRAVLTAVNINMTVVWDVYRRVVRYVDANLLL